MRKVSVSSLIPLAIAGFLLSLVLQICTYLRIDSIACNKILLSTMLVSCIPLILFHGFDGIRSRPSLEWTHAIPAWAIWLTGFLLLNFVFSFVMGFIIGFERCISGIFLAKFGLLGMPLWLERQWHNNAPTSHGWVPPDEKSGG